MAKVYLCIEKNKMNKEQLSQLQTSLLFLHVKELKTISEKLGLLVHGKKGEIIDSILYYLKTGQQLSIRKIPKSSCALRGVLYELLPDAKMLKGAYKNDLKTRLFFKSLIGQHFHFTAFGIDWLHEKWMQGTPPTYQQFADMWQCEFEKRKKLPAIPKMEWAYINFVQAYVKELPTADRTIIMHAWDAERKRHVALVRKILGL